MGSCSYISAVSLVTWNTKQKNLCTWTLFLNSVENNVTVDKIISKYSAHLVFRKLKGIFSPNKECETAFEYAKDINQIIKPLNVDKAKDPDRIFAKFIKMAADII